MTASRVLLDTWAWWEVLFETEVGQQLSERYVEDPTVAVHSSALALGEIAAKLGTFDADDLEGGLELPELERRITASIRAFSELHDVTPTIARDAGKLRSHLRDTKGTASLADAIMLVTARDLEAILVSDDGAFADEPDVRSR